MSKLWACPSLVDIQQKEFFRRRQYDMQYVRRGFMAALIPSSLDSCRRVRLSRRYYPGWGWIPVRWVEGFHYTEMDGSPKVGCSRLCAGR